jgi:molybdopterin-guanine dinucleotide biosynthesis protein B
VFLPKDTKEDADRIDQYTPFGDLFADCDVVLVEGHSKAGAPKIEVWRDELTADPLAVSDSSIAAVVSDAKPAVSVPIWCRSDVGQIARRVLELIGVAHPA